jgi:hypothetical protein
MMKDNSYCKGMFVFLPEIVFIIAVMRPVDMLLPGFRLFQIGL